MEEGLDPLSYFASHRDVEEDKIEEEQPDAQLDDEGTGGEHDENTPVTFDDDRMKDISLTDDPDPPENMNMNTNGNDSPSEVLTAQSSPAPTPAPAPAPLSASPTVFLDHSRTSNPNPSRSHLLGGQRPVSVKVSSGGGSSLLGGQRITVTAASTPLGSDFGPTGAGSADSGRNSGGGGGDGSPYSIHRFAKPVSAASATSPSQLLADSLAKKDDTINVDWLLSGERMTLTLSDAAAQHWIHNHIPGTFYMTTYRIVFKPSSQYYDIMLNRCPNALSYFDIPLGCISDIELTKNMTSIRDTKGTGVGIQFTLHCKDVRG